MSTTATHHDAAGQQTGTSQTAVRPFQMTFPEAELDRGGHFAAWEQPRLFADEMRAAFRSLR